MERSSTFGTGVKKSPTLTYTSWKKCRKTLRPPKPARAEKPSSPEGGAMVEEPPRAKALAPLRRKDPPSFNFPGTVLVIDKSDFTHEGYDHAFLKPYHRTTPPEFGNRSLME